MISVHLLVLFVFVLSLLILRRKSQSYKRNSTDFHSWIMNEPSRIYRPPHWTVVNEIQYNHYRALSRALSLSLTHRHTHTRSTRLSLMPLFLSRSCMLSSLCCLISLTNTCGYNLTQSISQITSNVLASYSLLGEFLQACICCILLFLCQNVYYFLISRHVKLCLS